VAPIGNLEVFYLTAFPLCFETKICDFLLSTFGKQSLCNPGTTQFISLGTLTPAGLHVIECGTEFPVLTKEKDRQVYRRAAVILIVILVVLAAAALLEGADRGEVGAVNCGVCHQAQYQAWLNGPHSKTFSTLTPEQRKDPKCLRCHTMSSADDLQGVQCEVCHGSGKYYSRDYIMKDIKLAEAVGLKPRNLSECANCHTQEAPCIKPFNAEEAWSKLPHSKTGNVR